MEKRLYTLMIVAFCLLSVRTSAQNTGKNLLKNGDFEGGWEEATWTPKEWTHHMATLKEDTGNRPNGKGSHCLMIYPNGGTLKQGGFELVPGATYRLSVWGKTKNSGGIRLSASIYYLNKEEYVQENYFSFSLKPDWEEVSYEFTVPDNDYINQGRLTFFITSKYNAGEFWIDDVSLVKGRNGGDEEEPEENVLKPQNVDYKAFQREIDLKWQKSGSSNVSYEVTINGTKKLNTENNSLTLEELEPGTRYNIEIRAVQNKKFSEPTKIIVDTRKIERAEEERIPYLRTIRESSGCSRQIKTYWENLKNGKAKFIYKLDGKEIKPDKDHTLTLRSEAGGFYENHYLEISIDEGKHGKWQITYLLSVTK